MKKNFNSNYYAENILCNENNVLYILEKKEDLAFANITRFQVISKLHQREKTQFLKLI